MPGPEDVPDWSTWTDNSVYRVKMPEGKTSTPKSGGNGSSRQLKRIAITGIEKRYKPDKHYVFIIQVKWTDKTDYVVYRNYNQFFDFHMNLMEVFPLESGAINPQERIIPFLPGRRLFRRNEVQQVATSRQLGLADYCRKLLNLPDRIKTTAHVTEFFTATPTDITPPRDVYQKKGFLRTLLPFFYSKDSQSSTEKDPDDLDISEPLVLEPYIAVADYKASDKREVSFSAGQQMEILEKNENGWWFVQMEDTQGWAPASYLDPLNQAEEPDEPEPCLSGEKFITLEKYEAQFEDEISVESGAIVYVMHKLLDGWWIVSYQQRTGYMPAAYLMPYTNKHLRRITLNRRTTFRPIPRRRTLNKVSTKWNNKRPGRDLSVYGRASVKFKNRPTCPDRDDGSAIYEEEEELEADYENTEMFLAELERAESSKWSDIDEPTYDDTVARQPALHAQHEEEGEEYVNVPEAGAAAVNRNNKPAAMVKHGIRVLPADVFRSTNTIELPSPPPSPPPSPQSPPPGSCAVEPYRAVADYVATETMGVNLKSGQAVQVLQKNNNGWWLVRVDGRKGWCPSPYLEPLLQPEERDEPEPCLDGEKYLVVESYRASNVDELSFRTGDIIFVLHKLLDGWWIVSDGIEAGFAPAVCLVPYSEGATEYMPAKSKLVPRRSYLKSVDSKWTETPAPTRDLDRYREASRKIRQPPRDVVDEDDTFHTEGSSSRADPSVISATGGGKKVPAAPVSKPPSHSGTPASRKDGLTTSRKRLSRQSVEQSSSLSHEEEQRALQAALVMEASNKIRSLSDSNSHSNSNPNGSHLKDDRRSPSAGDGKKPATPPKSKAKMSRQPALGSSGEPSQDEADIQAIYTSVDLDPRQADPSPKKKDMTQFPWQPPVSTSPRGREAPLEATPTDSPAVYAVVDSDRKLPDINNESKETRDGRRPLPGVPHHQEMTKSSRVIQEADSPPIYTNVSLDGRQAETGITEKPDMIRVPRNPPLVSKPQHISKSLDEANKRAKSPPPTSKKPVGLGKVPKAKSESSAPTLDPNSQPGLDREEMTRSRVPPQSSEISAPDRQAPSYPADPKRGVGVGASVQKGGILGPAQNKLLIAQLKAKQAGPTSAATPPAVTPSADTPAGVLPPPKPPRIYANITQPDSPTLNRSQGPISPQRPQEKTTGYENRKDENNNMGKKPRPIPRKCSIEN